MKTAFTPAIAYQMIKRAKANFRKNKLAPKEWKEVLDKLDVHVCLAKSIKYYPECWAMSMMLNKYHGKVYGIDPSQSTIKIGRSKWWLAIEFKAEFVCTVDNASVFNLIAHELAHSLDYVIRQKMQEPKESHDEFFRVLQSLMGGTEDYRFPHRVGVQKRITKSIDSFGGVSRVASIALGY